MSRPQKLVVIGGCGHVGLPLGIVLANAGVDVSLPDVDEQKIALVNSGEMPFRETAADELLRVCVGKTLVATSDVGCLRGADAAVAVLGSRVNEHLNPTVTNLYGNIDSALENLKDGALLVLRNAVYQGVTKLFWAFWQESRSLEAKTLAAGQHAL